MEETHSAILDTDRAWAAGFFDADGTTVTGGWVRKDGSMYYSVRLSLGQAKQQWDDLNRFMNIVGCGKLYDKRLRKDARSRSNVKTWSPYKVWQVQNRNDVAVCFNILWPWLGSYKRLRWERAEEKAVASRRTPNGAGVKSAP